MDKKYKQEQFEWTLWMPNKDSRVCNLHFVDGEPTAENPDPTLQLGHSKKTRASKRPPPTPRDNSLAVRFRKRAKLDTCSDEIPVPVLDHSADNLACDDVELQHPEPSNDCVDIDRASVIHDHCYVYGWYEINENSRTNCPSLLLVILITLSLSVLHYAICTSLFASNTLFLAQDIESNV